MYKRPLSVTLIGVLFMGVGVVAVAYHASEFKRGAGFQWELVGVCLVRVLAIAGGGFASTRTVDHGPRALGEPHGLGDHGDEARGRDRRVRLLDGVEPADHTRCSTRMVISRSAGTV